ncbi:MCE family protein [Thiorhodococcus mannitoliphagus]|uniref:MCE family protein n=1 Tax=Thiorhodococcus mannitoliphagus TaxID=329406 RepID=A0A6P1DUT6_9GAMM|nr:MlaD family protein [Thiorhodococcus mannitoliphagus]NEX20953.1 MCE family protein [Thiorhodococcus mannitoliphagus]
MAEVIDGQSLPRATLTPKRRGRVSAVWLIPLFAALVAVGIAVNRILNEGPTITILFKSAEGVEAGKTFIKYKDVKIGEVSAVELHDNFSKVLVTAKIDKHAEDLMVQDASFWVVQPRVTLSGVSGLGTLLSGNYIGFEKGKSTESQRRFIGLEVAPVITMDQPGKQFELTAADMGSLGIGSPLYFRRLQVGQVIASKLAADGDSVQFKVFVNAPYDRFISAETRFWNASGLDVSLGADGVDVRTQSLVSLLIGGVAFETPTFLTAGEPAVADSAFPLFADRTTAMKQPDAIARHYVLYFDDSLRGLSVGAPVTLLGLEAGEVIDVGFEMDPGTLVLRGRVEVVAYPERLVARLRSAQAEQSKQILGDEQQSHAFLQRLIEERGLRGHLRSGSLVTGQLYIAFDYVPDAPKVEIDWDVPMPVIPTVPSTLPNLEDKVTGILDKVDKIPFEAIGNEIKEVLATLDNAIKDIDKAVDHIDTGVTPELKSGLVEFRRALASAERVLNNTDATLLGPNAPAQIELSKALQEVARAARSVRVLADYLERNPGALIRGKGKLP